MYGLPANIDLTPFHGKELTQVCVGAAQFQLHFSDGKTKNASVFVESGWALRTEGQILDFSGEAPDRSEEAKWLARLIGKALINAEAVGPGTLRLYFADGWTVDILDDSTTYESYQIAMDDKLIVV